MIRNWYLAVAAVALTAALGTGPVRAIDPAAETPAAETPAGAPAEPVVDPAKTGKTQPAASDTAPADAATPLDPVVEAQARLGLALAATLAAEPGAGTRDHLVSPLSLSSSLSLLYIGAEGGVKTVMDKALGFGGEGFSKFRALSRDFDGTPEVSVAANLWFDTDATPIRSGLIALKHEFGLKPQPIDFGAADNAAKQINGWVEKKTAGAIDSVVDHLSEETEFVAAGALHFKGTWLYTFDPNLTQNGTFHAASGKTREVPFMTRSDSGLHIFDKDGWLGVDLAYKGGRYGLVALLPPEGTRSLQPIVTTKTDAEATVLLDRLRGKGFTQSMEKLTLVLPRVTLHTACDCLPAVRQTLGIAKDGGKAMPLVFPGLIGSEVSDIRIASRLTLDEEGTVASSASVVSGARSLVREIRFDRPFLMALREKKSGMILFLALVQDLGDPRTASN